MATQLQLQIGMENDNTVIKNSFFTSPLKLGFPRSYQDRLQIVLMMASAGILKGDSFCYRISCEAGTRAFLTEQSYTKIFDTGELGASKDMEITLEQDASLFYLPCAVIPFANSSFDGSLTVRLAKESEFACCDIVSVGRVGMGERLKLRRYHNRICVLEEGLPVWLDHCLWEPAVMPLDSLFFLDGYTHQGSFYYHGSSQKEALLLSHVQELAAEPAGRLYIGASRAKSGICIRALGCSAQDIEELFTNISGHMQEFCNSHWKS